ncbi:hypothetical protein DVH24_002823 [Malus domestica]|uniref:Uncharacterized protein n=1 Tax=Malus domestica TaxID=3750 RepID=A0A498KA97_MALDO|nr:hypothetical protein DVH24_002823 [Malus domestica]
MASTLILNPIATFDRARDSSRRKKKKKIQPKQDHLHHQEPAHNHAKWNSTSTPPSSSTPSPKPPLTRHPTHPPLPPTTLLLLPLHDAAEPFMRPPTKFSSVRPAGAAPFSSAALKSSSVSINGKDPPRYRGPGRPGSKNPSSVSTG